MAILTSDHKKHGMNMKIGKTPRGLPMIVYGRMSGERYGRGESFNESQLFDMVMVSQAPNETVYATIEALGGLSASMKDDIFRHILTLRHTAKQKAYIAVFQHYGAHALALLANPMLTAKQLQEYLQLGIDITVNFHGENGLHYAMLDSNIDSAKAKLKIYLQQHTALINSPSRITKFNNTPLFAALANEHFEIVEFAVKQYTQQIDFRATDGQGKTMLMMAIRMLAPVSCIKQILANTPNEFINTRDSIRGATALHYACALGDKALVIELLNKGADLNSKDHQGLTPLAYATNPTLVAEFLQEMHIHPQRDSKAKTNALLTHNNQLIMATSQDIREQNLATNTLTSEVYDSRNGYEILNTKANASKMPQSKKSELTGNSLEHAILVRRITSTELLSMYNPLTDNMVVCIKGIDKIRLIQQLFNSANPTEQTCDYAEAAQVYQNRKPCCGLPFFSPNLDFDRLQISGPEKSLGINIGGDYADFTKYLSRNHQQAGNMQAFFKIILDDETQPNHAPLPVI